MRKYVLIGFVFIGLIIGVFSPPIVSSVGYCQFDSDCQQGCPFTCSGDAQCQPNKAECKNNTCRCDCSGCDISNTGACGYGPWYDCAPEGCKCREILDSTATAGGTTCEASGRYESTCDPSSGGTDSSCGNAAPPGCSGWCGSGTHCANDSGAHSCGCKTNHTCAEFLAPLHWPVITRTSETTAIVSWAAYFAPERAADTLSISVYPENINPGPGCNGCIVNQEVDPYIIGYVNVTGLEPGTLYTMSAIYYPLGYVCGGQKKNFLSSCTMTPDPLNLLSAGETGTLTTGLNLSQGQTVGITYESSVPAVATVSNVRLLMVNSVESHSTTATAVSDGSTIVSSVAKMLVIDGDQFLWDQVCRDTATVNVAPTATPIPTAVPSNPWVKLKNTSYISKNNLDNPIPAAPAAYDVDDTTEPYFITGSGGVVSTINLGTNPGVMADNPEYKAAGLSPTFLMTPDSFLSYIKARKQSVTITSLGEISGPGIYIYEGADSLDINAPLSVVFNNNIVLLTTGTVNINTDFNPTGSVAIVADQIFFGNTVAQARGVFIANTINSGTASFGLKIIGNLIAQTSLSNNRTQTDPNQPAIFVVYDPVKYNNFYVDLLPYLSTANYDWRQIQ